MRRGGSRRQVGEGRRTWSLEPGRGVVAAAKGGPFSVEELRGRDPGPGEVLVRIAASGVCHSDMHYVDGHLGDDFPFLLGHEGSGYIESVGDGVDAERVGQFVVLTYQGPLPRVPFLPSGPDRPLPSTRASRDPAGDAVTAGNSRLLSVSALSPSTWSHPRPRPCPYPPTAHPSRPRCWGVRCRRAWGRYCERPESNPERAWR